MGQLRGSCLVVGLGLAFLAGCNDQGFSGVDAEWDRRHAGPYYVVSAKPERAVVSAKGRQVAIEPTKGFCLAEESVEATQRSAFALIGDCALDTPTGSAPRGARGELKLPRGVPGIITVSVSGDPGFDQGSVDKTLNGLSAYLDTAEGSNLLGRSGDATKVEVIESKRIENGIFVLVDDGSAGIVPVFDPRFWRAFVELNGRLAVVTVSGFRDRPLDKDEMLKHLVRQVETLKFANRVPINEPGVLLASAGQGNDSGSVRALRDIRPEPLVVATVQSEPEPEPEPAPATETDTAPVPLKRPTPEEEALIGQAIAEAAGADPEAPEDGGPGAPAQSVIPKAASRQQPPEPEATVAAATPASEPTPEAESGAPAVTAFPDQPVAAEGDDVPPEETGSDTTRRIASDPTEETGDDLAPTRFAPKLAPAAPRRPRQA